MADIENTAQNTAGEAGINTDIDYKSYLDKFIGIMDKRAQRTVENLGNNVIKQGFSNLSEDLQTQLYNDYLANEAKKKNAEIEKYNKTVKELEKANARIAEFENQAKANKISSEFNSILSKAGVSNQKSIDYISKMAGDLNQFYKEDGSIDADGINSVINSILTDIPSLKDEHKTIYYEQPKSEDQAKSIEDAELDAIFGINK